MSYVGQAGSGTLGTGFQGTGHITFTTTRDIPVGSTALLVASMEGGHGVSWSSVSDGHGNTWVKDLDSGTRNYLAVFRCNPTTDIPSGSTITITASGATAWAGEAVLDLFDDTLTATPLDKTASVNAFSSFPVTVGPTAATTQANELVYACESRGGSFATPSGYSAAGSSYTTSYGVQAAYKEVTSTGTQSAAWGSSGTGEFVGFVLTYKTSGGAGFAPSNSVAPAVTGTPTQGKVLSTDNGTWTGSPTSYAYQWQRDNSGGGTYSNISAATSSTYTLGSSDVGCRVRCVVTATNANGSTAANSNAVGLIGPLYSYSVSMGGEFCAFVVAGQVLSRSLADTGLTMSDTLATPLAKALADTGLAVTDSTRRSLTRLFSDAGLSVGDSVAVRPSRKLADTGVSVSESLKRAKLIVLADTGLTISSGTVVTGHVARRAISDVACTLNDTVAISLATMQPVLRPRKSWTMQIVGQGEFSDVLK